MVGGLEKLAIFDVSSDTTPKWTSTTTLVADTEYDVALYAENGTTTTNGRIECAIYPKGSNTPTETMTAITNANTGTGALVEVRSGKCNNSVQVGDLRQDSIQVGDDYTTLPLAPVGNPTGVGHVQRVR
jgi:hypothetical protein